MKKLKLLIVLSLFSLFFVSCSKQQSLEGNWITVGLIKENVAQQICESNIKFVYTGKQIKANGCAGVNLYKTDIKIKGRSITASNMENTGFMGTRDEMDFENLFFEALMNENNFKVEDKSLYIFNNSNNMELHLIKKE